MYDRKKITLFILLIATVILGGVSLYLATQINQSQAPDDSLAGGICRAKDTSNPDSVTFCNSLSSNTCVGYLDTCELIGTSTCPVPEPGDIVLNEGAETCVGTKRYRCQQGGQNATVFGCCAGSQKVTDGEFCDDASKTKRTCSGGLISTDGICCTGYERVGSQCVLQGGGSSGGGQTGTNNCTQSGQTITHGATSCIDGTNYSCSNGTVTPGGSCGATTPDPGTTGSACVSTAPTKAKLTSPGNGAVINTTTATLAWDRNGTFGEGCESQNNEFRVRVTTVGLTEACPTNTSNSGSYTKVGTVDAAPAGTFNLAVESGKKYCWVIRKHNGAEATDSGIRSFTVDIAAVAPTTGVDEEETGGTTTGDIDPTTGEVLSASGSGSLPATAIISDELDPLILGMILVIIGLTLYKFDFGRKREEA